MNISLLDATKELIAAAAAFDNKLHAGFKVSELSAEQSQLYNAVNTAKAAVHEFEQSQASPTSNERSEGGLRG